MKVQKNLRATTTGILAMLFLILIVVSGCVENTKCRNPEAEVFFCPQDNCAERIVEKIESSRQSIHVAIYSLTEDSISEALIAAHKRGIEVKVLFDKQQAENEYSDDEALQAAGVSVRKMDKQRGSMHDKFAIIDGNIVATGSFNYTANANQYNNENLLFISCSGITQKYEEEFQMLWESALLPG